MRLRFGRRSDIFMSPYEAFKFLFYFIYLFVYILKYLCFQEAEREYRSNQEMMDADAEE